MKFQRTSILAMVTLALLPALSTTAQDPAISKQMTRLRNSLPNQQYPQPDFKSLDAAAQSLLKKTPNALTPPTAMELNSPETEETQPPLDLSDDQREALLKAYQYYTGRLARLARTNPFTKATVTEINTFHRRLQSFMAGLEKLGKMRPDRSEYGTLIDQLIADAKPAPAAKTTRPGNYPAPQTGGGQR